MIISNNAPSVTYNTKSYISNGYVVAQDHRSIKIRKSIKFFRKQNLFGAQHSNIQKDAKLNYLISRVMLELDHTSLSFLKELCDLDVD